MLCPKCGRKMKHILSFDNTRNYQSYVCKCLFKTKKKRIHFEDIVKEK